MSPSARCRGRRSIAGVGALAALVTSCGGAPPRLDILDAVERARAATGAKEGAELAAETFARGDQEREIGVRAHASGDDVGATLHAERALAAYAHALAVARLARAGAELADAQKSLDDAAGQRQSLEASRAKLEAQGTELELRARIARERLLPAHAGAAPPERESARLAAARSLTVGARLLCGAARLVAPDAAGLADAAAEASKLEQRLEKDVRPAPIDDAGRVRASCLEVLTRARRAVGDEGRADGLLAELSANGQWDPFRDERGVVVTLRGVYRLSQLTDEGTAKLKELGRVAAAHPGFAVQVVVHDARPPLPKDDSDARRADLAVQALTGGGASASRTNPEVAGARLPVVDPNDAKVSARNERLEVVFVPGM